MDISNRKQVLRIATAGSVDDGKSTLIGRLLYDTNSIETDKLMAIEQSSRRKGLDYTDLSLLTDGLIAEREQGITIDVAHIYFSTHKRKFIIADTPGHIEYTRNMVTGASNADVSVILVDARHGLLEQTHRHLFISHLLAVPKVVVCVNKMDLVNYSEQRFLEIKNDFNALLNNPMLEDLSLDFIPVSSLYGQNVATQSKKMPWYKGVNLLAFLEDLEVHAESTSKPARFPIQSVIRPKLEEYHDYRGYAGKVESGEFKVGDKVVALPSGESSFVKAIQRFTEDLDNAKPKQSVTILLEDDIDLSRGDMLVKSELEPSKAINAKVCWMEKSALLVGKTYRLQHGVNEVKAKVAFIENKIQTSSFKIEVDTDGLILNDIGNVSFKLSKPIFADKFQENRDNGSFILIDEFTNNTVGVGLVE